MAFVSHVTNRRLVSKNPHISAGWMEEDEDEGFSFQQVSPRSTGRNEEAGGSPRAAESSSGITRIGEFVGALRCMQVIKQASSDASGPPNLAIWTGDQDGALGVRDVRGKEMCTIEKHKSTFVSSLLCHGSDVFPSKFIYAGMSDGNIRIYEQSGDNDYKLLSVARRRHNAAITCMLAVRQYVVTGGADWWMFVWEWSGGVPSSDGTFGVVKDQTDSGSASRARYSRAYAGGKISLHRNSVRCLAHDAGNGVLYTGGDDAAIFAIPWHRDGINAAGTREVGGARPKLQHRGSVRALVVYEYFLFSASEDGSVRVWSVLSTDEQGRVTGGMHQRTIFNGSSPLRCMLKDPAAGRIWVGGGDGLLRVFDATDHSLVCEMARPHSGAMITGLHCIGRLDAQKWWVAGEDGKVRCLYLESDAPEFGNGGHVDREAQLGFQVANLREITICNYREMDKRKAQILRLQNIDEGRKVNLVAALGRATGNEVQRRYLLKLRTWFSKRNERIRRRQMGALLGRNLVSTLTLIYLRKWKHWRQRKQREAVANTLGETLLAQSKDGLQILYFGKLREYRRRDENRRKRRMAAENLLATTTRGLLHIVFGPWVDMTKKRAHFKKKSHVSEMLMGMSDRGIKTLYFHKLQDFERRESDRKNRLDLGHMMLDQTDKGLREHVLKKWMKWVALKKRNRKREDFASALMGVSEMGLRRVYHRKAITFTLAASRIPLHAEQAKLDAEIEELEAMLREADTLSDAEIEAQIEETQRTIKSTQEAMPPLRDAIERERRKMEALETKATSPSRPDLGLDFEGKSKAQQVTYFLHQAGVHCIMCGADSGFIGEMHNEKDGPVALLVKGMQGLKENLRKFIISDSGEEWAERAFETSAWQLVGGWNERIDLRSLRYCHQAVRLMVYAAHRIKNGTTYSADPRTGKKHKNYEDEMAKLEKKEKLQEEILHNVDVILSIVFAMSDIRKRRDGKPEEEPTPRSGPQPTPRVHRQTSGAQRMESVVSSNSVSKRTSGTLGASFRQTLSDTRVTTKTLSDTRVTTQSTSRVSSGRRPPPQTPGQRAPSRVRTSPPSGNTTTPRTRRGASPVAGSGRTVRTSGRSSSRGRGLGR